MGQNYHHLSALERNVLQHQLNLGSSQALIALTLGRSRSTVSREARRKCVAASPSSGSGLGYDASIASQASFARRRRGLVRLAKGSSLRAAVLKQIRLGWSPQHISGRLKLMDQPQSISHGTIYQAIYVLPKGELRSNLIGLLRQGRKLRRPRSQGKIGAEPCPIWFPCMNALIAFSQHNFPETGRGFDQGGGKRQRHRQSG